MNIPEIVVLVPYRNRKEHYDIFSNKIHSFLNPWKHMVLYIHQNDSRSFNRGAMKNIGFLVVREMFPMHYKSITLVFNDIDSIPQNIQLNYKTSSGIVKHFYGYNFTLGGIVSILAEDFERIGGFPNYWGWGYEDNMLQFRCLENNLVIDRTQFYPCGSPNIMRLSETHIRQMNIEDYNEFRKKTDNGWKHIQDLQWKQEGEFIHVENFTTGREENVSTRIEYNVRNGIHPFSPRGKIPGLFNTSPVGFSHKLLKQKRTPSRTLVTHPSPIPVPHSPSTKLALGKMIYNRPKFSINMHI